MDRFHCPKYTIKESNLPDVDVFVQTHTQQFTGWDQLVMDPPVRHFYKETPIPGNWDVLDRKLPMHTYNVTGVIQYQAPLETWPKCGVPNKWQF